MKAATKQENIEVKKLDLEKRYQKIIHYFFRKTATTNNAAAQAESEDAEAQAEKENAAAAGANCENAEAKTEEVEIMYTGSMMNDSVETANETGGKRRGCLLLRTVNEEGDRTVGDGHHAQCSHPVVEAGSIVLQVSNNMSEGKKTMKKQARQQQQKRLKRFQKDVEIRRLIEERRSTPKEEKQWLKGANAWTNVSEIRKEWNDSKTSKEHSKISKV